jgi:hypothetical protein
MPVELGIIEGYYGTPWSWEARREQAAFLAPYGYRFYIYAPKADAFLRKRWREEHPRDQAEELHRTASRCAELGVRFGVGLSPYEIYRDFNAEAREALSRKLQFLDAVGVQQLGILFDDMRGDLPDLARTQVGIVHWIAERTQAKRIVVCPSYYTDDPVLDRVFGQRPARYLEDLGRGLDPAIDVFWTGEEVCAREFSPGHLERVGDQLRRRPLLWDNYPVNDGPRMSPYLYVRAFTGRPASIGPHIAGHAVNPALQPVLSRIPAISLAESYRLGADYQYGEAFRTAAQLALGPELANLAERHIGFFQDVGLDRLEPDTATRLRERYGAFDHPAAREVLAWLDGAYRITREMVAES